MQSDAWTSWCFSVNLLNRCAKKRIEVLSDLAFRPHWDGVMSRKTDFWKCVPKCKNLTTLFSRCSVDCENGDTSLVMWHILYHWWLLVQLCTLFSQSTVTAELGALSSDSTPKTHNHLFSLLYVSVNSLIQTIWAAHWNPCLPPAGHPRCRWLCFFSRTQTKIFN